MKYLRKGKRSTGFALPLLSLNTAEGPCGEFPDIVLMARLAKSWGMNLLQILPVNDTGFETSPYSALSAFALNPIYVRIADLPELGGDASYADEPKKKEAQAAGEQGKGGNALRDFTRRARIGAEAFVKQARQQADREGAVPYERILSEKLSILESLWNSLAGSSKSAALMRQVEDWSAAKSWVKTYACFVELKRRNRGKPWWEWDGYRNPDAATIQNLWANPELATSLRFHAWVQMRAEEQFAEACRKALNLGVDVMGDIPILLNKDSAEVWERRSLFDLDFAAGAPPDMYSRLGQNWGFPLYRWDVIEKEGYSFWKERLSSADQFYSLFRIDHVLGFFRIWAVDIGESDGFLGHFRPEYPLLYHELDALGFDAARIRWLSKPHVPESLLDEAFEGLPAEIARSMRETLFRRIDAEPLFLFFPEVRGGRDIEAMIQKAMPDARADAGAGADSRADAGAIAGVNSSAVAGSDASIRLALEACRDRLLAAWRDRSLLETSPGQFFPTWEYRDTKAWKSLGDEERLRLEGLMARRKAESMSLWERNGAKILKILADSVAMQACAEDLGAVPPCVPAALSRLGIPGLRVLRWHRAWDKEGAPYIALDEYPEGSVACMSVHDSSNLRQWWEEEADRPALWDMLGPKSAASRPAPASLRAEDAYALLLGFSAVNSRILVHPLQDLLAADARYRELDPARERINLPGTSGGMNWRYRLKPRIEELLRDADFAALMRAIATAREV